MSNLVWTPFKEQIFSYLWYLRSADMELAAKFTEMPIKECDIKRGQFPEQLPLELRHSTLLDQVAMSILQKSSKEDFSTSVRYLSRFGLKSIEKVYIVWNNTYIQSKRPWNITDLRTLKWAMANDESIQNTQEPWRKIADLFLDRTPDQCREAYEAHRKNLDNIINTKEVPWVIKDLGLLQKYVNKDKKLSGEVDWPRIASKFFNKTVYECKTAYNQYGDYKQREKAAAILMKLRHAKY